MLVAEAMPRPYASGVVAHGWNIDEESLCHGMAASTPVLVTGWNVAGRGSRGLLSTLLGPEATGHGIRSSCRAAGGALVGAGRGGAGWSGSWSGRVFLD